MPVNFFNLVAKHRTYLYIKTNKKSLKKELQSWDVVKNVDNHPNPYQAMVRFKDGKSISLANIIHFKFDTKTLKHIFHNLESFLHEQHGLYENYSIKEHHFH